MERHLLQNLRQLDKEESVKLHYLILLGVESIFNATRVAEDYSTHFLNGSVPRTPKQPQQMPHNIHPHCEAFKLHLPGIHVDFSTVRDLVISILTQDGQSDKSKLDSK